MVVEGGGGDVGEDDKKKQQLLSCTACICAFTVHESDVCVLLCVCPRLLVNNKMAQRHSDDDMEFGDEDFSGGDSIIIRLGNSSWGEVAGQDSEDEDEDDVETMRNNPLALLLQWFNRSSRITRSQTAQQTRLPLFTTCDRCARAVRHFVSVRRGMMFEVI